MLKCLGKCLWILWKTKDNVICMLIPVHSAHDWLIFSYFACRSKIEWIVYVHSKRSIEWGAWWWWWWRWANVDCDDDDDDDDGDDGGDGDEVNMNASESQTVTQQTNNWFQCELMSLIRSLKTCLNKLMMDKNLIWHNQTEYGWFWKMNCILCGVVNAVNEFN